jgi:hypothetical protein
MYHWTYLVDKTDLNVDRGLLNKLLAVQQLSEEDRENIQYSIDGLIQHAKTRQAYKKQKPNAVVGFI